MRDRYPPIEAPLTLWFKTFYEAVGLPKLNGVAINGDFCEPPRLFLIKAAEINPVDNVAVGPDHIARYSSIALKLPPENLAKPTTGTDGAAILRMVTA